MADEWFRKSSWSEDDAEDFFSHLARSRKYNRAQYLRIQALHLSEVATPELFLAALHLLEILFVDYPDKLEMASGYLQKAECLLGLGKLSESLIYLRKSIDFQRGFPNVRTYAVIRFGLTVVEHCVVEDYQDAINILDEFEDDEILFPIDEYRIFAIRAIVESRIGSSAKAGAYARRAIAASIKTHSGFRNHPKLGLVNDAEPELAEKLHQILQLAN